MPIIDSQIHAYEANTPKRPWDTVPNWPPHVTGDEMVAAMNKVGVDGAIFISAFSMYRYDASYAVEVQRAHPGKFGLVKPVDPDNPDVADVVAEWKKTPGAVGIRIMLTKEGKRDPSDPGLDRIARAAAKYDFPVNILCWDNLDAGMSIIDRNPDTRFILDHLGILQPRVPPASEAEGGSLADKADAILAKVNTIPFEAIGQNLRQIMARVSKLAASPEIDDSLLHLDNTLKSLDQMTAQVRPKVGPLVDKLNQTAEQLRQAASSANGVLSGIGAGQDASLAGAIHQLTDAARAIRALAEYLERHPEAVLSGKKS